MEAVHDPDSAAPAHVMLTGTVARWRMPEQGLVCLRLGKR